MSNIKKEPLHGLIRSLTSSEKRFFKLFANRNTQGKENKYILLFDAISKQETYDEKKNSKRIFGERICISNRCCKI